MAVIHVLDEVTANQIAAGCARQPSDAAGESGKYRKTDCAQQQVDRNGYGCALTAKQTQCRKNGEGLQRKRNREGNGNPCTYRNERNKQGDKCDFTRGKIG